MALGGRPKGVRVQPPCLQPKVSEAIRIHWALEDSQEHSSSCHQDNLFRNHVLLSHIVVRLVLL